MIRPLWLRPEAICAAERLGEIAGVPATELVEMVLLELAASAEIVEAEGKRARSKPLAHAGSARVVPIESARGRPRRSRPARMAALRRRAEASGTPAEAVPGSAVKARPGRAEVPRPRRDC